MLAEFGAALGAQVLGAYPLANFSSPGAAYVRVQGDSQMTCPNRDTAMWLTAAGRDGGPQPAYLYLYAHANEFLNVLIPGLGVAHATELLNVWDIGPLLGGPGEQAQSDLWVRYWTRFAASGDPNGASPAGGDDPAWLPYGGAGVDSWAVLDTSADGPTASNERGLRKAQCDMWQANGVR